MTHKVTVRSDVVFGALLILGSVVMRGRENNLLVRKRGIGPGDEAYEGKGTKDSLEDL